MLSDMLVAIPITIVTLVLIIIFLIWVEDRKDYDVPSNSPELEKEIREARERDLKWNILPGEAMEKYGSAIDILKEMKADGKTCEHPYILSLAALELNEKLERLEKPND